MENIKTYTTKELEPILHLTKRVIDRKCRQGKIPAKKSGRGWIMEEQSLNTYLRVTRKEVRKC